MDWPAGQDYSEVIQNPRLAFDDPELQAGNVETDSLGLPKPRSGNFAVVFRMHCGVRSWAVKCFTREVSDQQKRYAAISAHLHAFPLPYTVAFEYQTQGIRVRGHWFPVLKMEWVSGVSLIKFIEAHLQDPGALRALAYRWATMVKVLRTAGVAHGDLQHGNVLVVGQDLKLLDYDGMFVPALAGAPPPELGHPNYQHPNRAELPFGPDLDNFAAWSIFTSLTALSFDPSLWSALNAGDDCLLFRSSDFKFPNSSKAFKILASSGDESLRSLVELFSQIVVSRVDLIPPLDTRSIAVPQHSTQFGWLEDHVNNISSSPAKAGSQSESSGSGEIESSWVLDFLHSDSAIRFTGNVFWPRLVMRASVTAALATLVDIKLELAIVAVLASANLIAVWVMYRREGGRASRASARRAVREIDAKLRTLRAPIADIQAQVRTRQARCDRDVASIKERIREAEERANREVTNVRRKLNADCAPTEKRRKQIDTDELAALADVARAKGQTVTSLRYQIANLPQQEAAELAKTLADFRAAQYNTILSSAAIADAQIPGVGPQLKATLLAHGIQSARDANRQRLASIPGFGPTRMNAVLAWASTIEQQAHSGIPQDLPGAQVERIRANYAVRRQTMELDLKRAEAEVQAEQTAIKARAAKERDEIDRLQAGPKATAANEIDVIRSGSNRAISYQKSEENRIIEETEAELKALQSTLEAERQSLMNVQWERAHATARLRACSGVTFARYLAYVLLGLSAYPPLPTT